MDLRAPPRGPRKRCQDSRIEENVRGAGVLVFIENFLPGLSAVGGAEDAALRVWSVGMADNGD